VNEPIGAARQIRPAHRAKRPARPPAGLHDADCDWITGCVAQHDGLAVGVFFCAKARRKASSVERGNTERYGGKLAPNSFW